MKRAAAASKAIGPFLVRAAGLTNLGLVRAANEDAFAVRLAEGLLVVSDGMGGHNAGAVASGVVVSGLPPALAQGLGALEPGAGLKTVVRAIDAVLRELSTALRRAAKDKPGLSGMGATVVMLLVRDGHAFVGSMGDSRAYLLRAGKLRALTRDHTVAEVLLAEGEITAEEAAVHPMRTALSRFVGMPEPAPPEVVHVALRAGDRLLLCSDGLTAMVPDDAIRDLLVRGATDEETCGALVGAALAAGGRDNVTVVLGEVAARRRDARPS